MRILEICSFSAGIDGVWQRVKQESLLLSERGHEVRIFSSNLTKGSKEKASELDKMGKVGIKRFPAIKIPFSESYMIWLPLGALRREIIKYKPKVIIAHGYRHTHTLIAVDAAKKIRAKAFLVTHAPFVEKDITRTFLSKWFIRLIHESFIEKSRGISKFDKIIAITKWEVPYLKKLGVKEDGICIIPNGIPEEFFKQKKEKEENKMLFLGRISPIKNLEVLIRAMSLLKNKKVKAEIVGKAEREYLAKLNKLAKELEISNRITFSPAIFDIKEKIRKIDSAKIFVLPSKREGMPQALIEAMAREKIVISSDNIGAKEIIKNGINGILFENNNYRELARLIDFSLEKNQAKMRKEAGKRVKEFEWSNIIRKIKKCIAD